ncbi:MAG TPA: methyltransferase domain-containing protein [Nitrospirota bacterium]|nr:methyltransferase domain-containing protein [Nitrospirota bacterium]
MSEPSKQRFSECFSSANGRGSIMRPGGFALTDRILQLCAFKAGDRVADIGCGFGATVEYLRRSYSIDAMGIDPAVASLGQGLRRNPGLPLSAGFAEELPMKSGTIDGIVAECSLSVIANKEQALAEFCRVLRVGGKMAITDIYARNAEVLDTIGDINLPFGMKGIMTQDTLMVMIRRQGFYITNWEDHSQTLKEYLIQTIMGDESSVFGRTCLGQWKSSWQESVGLLKRASLGYFLLVASKAA